MANWLLVIDADVARRKVFAAQVATVVAPIEGLQVAQREGADWSLIWAVARTAPVDVQLESSGGAVIWGEPRDTDGVLQNATAIRTAWHGGSVAQWDGYYSALALEEGGRSLTVGTDLLGIFPVYYWTDGNDLVLVGTSAELFRSHPRFKPDFNITGLVGILLTNGLVDGETLWRGVRRLGPGRRLRVENGKAWEDEGYRIPLGLGAVDLPLEGHVSQLADSIGAAVKRHTPHGRTYGLLLSGGLDSRMLAGFLAEQHAQIKSLTFGKTDDIEMRCAKKVAATLRFPHQYAEVAQEDYPTGATRLVRWEALASGFGGITEWVMHEHLCTVSDRIITGHMMDGIIGGLHLDWAYDNSTRKMSFESLLKNVTGWGFRPEILRKMLAPQYVTLVDDLISRLQNEYDNSASYKHHRAWIFDLQHRMRLHVGSAVWALSFASWPVLPFLDRDVLSVTAAMPCSSLADRRAQKQLLLTRFPTLAKLPLDRNSLNSRPLISGFHHELIHHLNEKVHLLYNTILAGARIHPGERLYYRRLFDLNSPGWKLVRKMAEPSRTALTTFLQPDLVKIYQPDPSVNIDNSGSIRSRSGSALLVGFALWAKQNM